MLTFSHRTPLIIFLAALTAASAFGIKVGKSSVLSGDPSQEQAVTPEMTGVAARAIEEMPTRLTLRSNVPVEVNMQYVVGADSLARLGGLDLRRNLGAPAPSLVSDEWNFIHRTAAGKSGWDKLGDLFDVDEAERPWSTTTTVHVLTGPESQLLVPFASVAHEVDSSDMYSRYGLGGGAMINLGKNASIGAEVLYFGDHLNETMARETRMMARLQIEF